MPVDLLDALVRLQKISPQQAAVVRRTAVDSAEQMEVVVGSGLVDEAELLGIWSEQTGIPHLPLERPAVDTSLLAAVPEGYVHQALLFPIREEDGELWVATCRPHDIYTLDDLSFETGKKVAPLLATRRQIHQLITQYLGLGSDTVDKLFDTLHSEHSQAGIDAYLEGTELSESEVSSSVVSLVNEILVEAIECRASDVHLEAQRSGLKLRFRIDGILHKQPVPEQIHAFASAIISRIKIMSRLNIAEKRLPQDGRMKLRLSGREVDVRVSVIPSLRGEGIVMRLLDQSNMIIGLSRLGMDQQTQSLFAQLIQIPHGVLLITGPTGSGKTTTLYSCLAEIQSEEKKIVTIEDPIEYELEGITQIQVAPRIGFTFARALRSILRHDPDAILVGEIRDRETVENAVQSALTGHLVFSTLHTNDAATAFTRLVDIGVEPFLIVSTVEAVMAQRLVRRLCERCREPYLPDEHEFPADFPGDSPREHPLFRPVGCDYCRRTGYRGRIGLFELLVATPDVKRLVHSRADSWEIKQAACRSGALRTLREDGWRKVLAGQTSLREVGRITRGDVQVPGKRPL